MTSRENLITNLVKLHSSSLTGYARSICGNIESAQDAVQEAFLRLCKLDYIDETRVVSWLFKTSKNIAVDYKRHAKYSAALDFDIESSEPNAADNAANNSEKERILFMVHSLPIQQSEAIVLRYYSGLNYSEIAQVMEISEGNVGSLISRALQALKKTGGSR